MVFVFIGDGDAASDLALDLQPGFLDDDLAIYPNGEHEIVKSNWRLAAENGVDASHIYIHRNSALINAARTAAAAVELFPDARGHGGRPGRGAERRGQGRGQATSVWETEIEGVEGREPVPARRQHRSTQRHRHLAVAALRPQGRPVPAARHHPVRVVRAARRAVASLHRHLGQAGERPSTKPSSSSARWTWCWKDLVVHKFNNEDVIAREAMEHFYAEEDGWNQEQLFRPDMIIAEWRRLASTAQPRHPAQACRAKQDLTLRREAFQGTGPRRKAGECRSRPRSGNP